MLRLPNRLISPALLATPALALATSCVPQPAPRAVAAQRVEQRPAALLRGLALEVPPALVDSDPPTTLLPPRINPAAAPPFLAVTRSPDDAARALECLTAAVYYEARSESLDGQRAVAQVVLNRVRDRAFPKSVCGVVYQGSTRRTGCQFSFTCDGSMNRALQPAAWDRARIVASEALSGLVYAPIGSATFYHANYVLPWWAASMARIGSVGAHIFYTWRGAMERALSFRQAYAGIEPGQVGAVGSSIATVAAGGVGLEQEVVAGVTIHRAGMTKVAREDVVAALTPVVVPAAPPRTTMVSGVRIHLGDRMPRHIVVAPAGMATAQISEETDPT